MILVLYPLERFFSFKFFSKHLTMDDSENRVSSEDELVFMGKFTLEEVKKRLGIVNHRQTFPCSASQHKDFNESVRLVETKSEPDISSMIATHVKSNQSHSFDEVSDESILKLEKLALERDLSSDNKEVDNAIKISHVKQESSNISISKISDETSNTIPKHNFQKNETEGFKTPSSVLQNCTPIKCSMSKSKLKSPCFLTPQNPASLKKSSSVSLKKTPCKSYQHIASPVAAYIRNSPQVPLVRDIHPKKPLPGVSSIPKLLKPKHQIYNKENVNLPTLAYKSAKSVKVIEEIEKDKLPQSQWAKKVTSSLPKPLVLKHIHREINSAKKLVANQEDSFADLTLHQAEVSVCTQRSAFDKPKKCV